MQRPRGQITKSYPHGRILRARAPAPLRDDPHRLRDGRFAMARITSMFAALALTLSLAGCGGGGDSGVLFDVGVLVNGQPLPSRALPGAVTDVDLGVGQSVELDATEPVVWTFTIGNSPLFASGTTVITNGVAIMQTDLSPSRVVIDTGIAGPLLLPIEVTLTATSTIDAAQVATVFLQIG
jgi:hypothetical protein